MLSRILLVIFAGLCGAAWYFALPPRADISPQTSTGLPASVKGVIHVHSNRSDGTGDVNAIAAAAGRAGLKFVIFTDHGDGLREPDPPRYVNGILCVDAVEISTHDGHLVALGLPEAPYPLGGEARDVLDDVARLGGFAIAAHPTSVKAELQWRAWESALDGLEWLNADSEWRDESIWSLARAVLTYPARRTETLVALLDRPDSALRRWDELTQSRRVVGVAASDAHARVGFRSLGEPYDSGSSLHVPSYEQMFRVLSNAITGVALTGDAAADWSAIAEAIRAGHVYSIVDGLGGPAALSFTASSGQATAAAGDALTMSGPIAIRVEIPHQHAQIALLKDGDILQRQNGPVLDMEVPAEPAIYRVEVSLPAAPGRPSVPWIVSNPIYVGREDTKPGEATPRAPASAYATQYGDGPAQGWVVETSPASLAALDVVPAAPGTQLSLRYGLGGAASASPFAAFVMPAGPDLAHYTQLTFTGRADRPTRISVQLREPNLGSGERWRRSVYLDSQSREITVHFDDMTASSATSRPEPTLANIQAVLFVVDSVNTALGANGTIWIDDVKYGR